jgi:hypothetical protein
MFYRESTRWVAATIWLIGSILALAKGRPGPGWHGQEQRKMA